MKIDTNISSYNIQDFDIIRYLYRLLTGFVMTTNLFDRSDVSRVYQTIKQKTKKSYQQGVARITKSYIFALPFEKGTIKSEQLVR